MGDRDWGFGIGGWLIWDWGLVDLGLGIRDWGLVDLGLLVCNKKTAGTTVMNC